MSGSAWVITGLEKALDEAIDERDKALDERDRAYAERDRVSKKLPLYPVLLAVVKTAAAAPCSGVVVPPCFCAPCQARRALQLLEIHEEVGDE